MSGYELTPHARDGLDQIIDSVAQAFGVRTAEKALDRLQEAVELLAKDPGLGHIREDLTGREDVWLWSVPPRFSPTGLVTGASRSCSWSAARGE
jgi:plasmid stabilization system protein ParE